jgi:Tfp pilus assembly protein PilF
MRSFVTIVVAGLLMVGAAGCAAKKPKPLVPLALTGKVSQAAIQATTVGTSAFQSGQFEEAKSSFEQAIAGAPDSGEAHYNLGLALFALGNRDQARDQFIQAANLSPGNQVIWDSPALSPFGNPDSTLPKSVKGQDHSNTRPTFGGVGPR